MENIPRKLILRNGQSPGDIVMMTAMVRDLHLSHPGKFLTDVRTPCPAIWEHNPYITRILDTDPAAEIINCEYPLIHTSNQNIYHFVSGFRGDLQQKLHLPIQPTVLKGDIHLSENEKQWVSQVQEYTGEDTKYWIICSGGKSDFTAKIWNPHRWQEVVDFFYKKITFVQVGEASHLHPKLENVIDFRGKTDLRQLIRLVYNSDGCLGGVSLLMHLCAAVQTRQGRPKHRPAVIVAGSRESTQWEAYPSMRYISTCGCLPCAPNNGCWRSRVIPLGDGSEQDKSLCEKPTLSEGGILIPKCLEMIRPSQVVRYIEQYLEFYA